ncbi:hypothetical protein HU200_031824 [Digitaria exilis]|uniref:F-box domain-containing protein n=1 Tax=Digitaria exilis TaxID=1010633 RepID=A0A835BL39_9POAL|nr:hypothetical protein HU200_031824 [Digitaria exilis]
MPLRKSCKMEGAGSGIDTLPDGVLQHILGFLPARDAVRTCVLARRWRDLWMFATGLRIISNCNDEMGELREFVDHLLLTRGIAPLETFELGFDGVSADDFCEGDVLRVNLWFRHAIRCQTASCHVTIPGNCTCILLEGLSEAKNLALIAESETFIFKKDLRHCPTFSKLKTLLLSDYLCVALDLDAITCILKHSPVLERLTLELFRQGSGHKMLMKGSYSPVHTAAAISEHLKIVEVKCEVVDERVYKVLKLLCTFNIRKLINNAIEFFQYL